MKGCLREDFCIHAEKVKSIEALHGSAHSQECLACLSLPVWKPGKTNNFTSSFARINKPWSPLEAKGNWAAFCFNYGRAQVGGKDFLSWSEKIPQVLHWALYKLAMFGMCCTGSSKPSLFALEISAFSSFPLNCLQRYTSFSLKDTLVPKLAQTGLGMSRWPCSPLSFQGFLLLSYFNPFLPSVRCICFSPFFQEHPHYCRNAVLHFGSHRHVLRGYFERWWWPCLVSSPPWVHSAQDNWPFPPGHNRAGFEVMDQPLPCFGCLAAWAVLLDGCFS